MQNKFFWSGIQINVIFMTQSFGECAAAWLESTKVNDVEIDTAIQILPIPELNALKLILKSTHQQIDTSVISVNVDH